MTPLLLGIDPGKTGAIAGIGRTGRLEFVEDMPNPLTGASLRRLLDSYLPAWPDRVAVEQVNAWGKQSGQTKFIVGYGIILGALGYAHIPYELILPAKWKKPLGLLGKDKDASRARAVELWPKQAHYFERKKDDGRAEAALLGYWLAEAQRHGRWAA